MHSPLACCVIYKSQPTDHFIMFRFPTRHIPYSLRLRRTWKKDIVANFNQLYTYLCICGNGGSLSNFRGNIGWINAAQGENPSRSFMSIHVFAVHRTWTRQRSTKHVTRLLHQTTYTHIEQYTKTHHLKALNMRHMIRMPNADKRIINTIFTIVIDIESICTNFKHHFFYYHYYC